MALPIVCLVRHGETEWTLNGRHTGRTDIPLTANGEAEARLLAGRLRQMPFADVFTSPLQRARRTCELAGYGNRAIVDPDLAEWDYGAYEGLRTVEIRAQRPTWRLFADGCPDGETADMVGMRADRVMARIRGSRGDVAVFSHRDFLRVFTARWVAMESRDARRFQMTTASVSILGYDHDLTEPVLREWNQTWR